MEDNILQPDKVLLQLLVPKSVQDQSTSRAEPDNYKTIKPFSRIKDTHKNGSNSSRKLSTTYRIWGCQEGRCSHSFKNTNDKSQDDERQAIRYLIKDTIKLRLERLRRKERNSPKDDGTRAAE